MPVFSKNGKHYLFVHIPKCGGTTIEVLFKKSCYTINYLATKADGVWGELNSMRWCSPQHMHAEILNALFDVSKFEKVFTVVRNPLDRFKSEYAMRNRMRTSVCADDVSEWVNMAFTKYAHNPCVFDNHLRPQHEFVLPGCDVLTFENGFDNLYRALHEMFPDLQESHMGHKMAGKQGALKSADVPLSGELVKKIRDFYALDYQLFYPDIS